MKLVCISDTHMGHEDIRLPGGDVLIHAGDATFSGSVREISAFGHWFSSRPHKHKIFIAGNHHWLFSQNRALAESLLPEVAYLEENEAMIDGIRFWGSPWTPEFGGWAFPLNHDHEARNHWAKMPDNLDVLITHGPPYSVQDRMKGDKMLLRRILKVRPKIHVFGHIHGGYGQIGFSGMRFYNVATMDDEYNIANKPVEVEL